VTASYESHDHTVGNPLSDSAQREDALAVTPALQRRGIGSALVHSGLDSVTAQGFEAVFVLGHPAYYPRFGFSAAAASKLASPYAGDAFMALELTPDALRGMVGTVTYPDAFEAD
jgi:putative acetyltransferase